MSDFIIKDNLYLYKLNKELVIEYILNELDKKNGLINKTIIMPARNYDALSFASVVNKKGYKALVVMPNNVDEKIINKIEEYKLDIVLTPYMLGLEAVIDMANDMKLDIENSLVLNLYEEKLNVSSYFKLIGPNIYNIVKDFNYLICPIDTGGAIVGLSKFFKMKSECYTIGLKDNNNLSKLLDDDLIDEINELDDLNFDTIYKYCKSFMSNNVNEKALIIYDSKKI